MDFIKEFISLYGNEILYTILTAVISFVGIKIKTLYESFINEKFKEEIVMNTVKYVEQIYADLTSDKKYEKAKENIISLLAEKGIAITDLELKVFIESACNNLKSAK